MPCRRPARPDAAYSSKTGWSCHEVLAHPLGGRRWAFELTIAEGRTHEVRRICDALGLEVERLVRIRFGPVRLGDLPSGAARALTNTERTVLDALIGQG